jgi:SagB-type dehydrogenase family enzyme
MIRPSFFLALAATCLLGAQPVLTLNLPPAATTGGLSLAEALQGRKSIRTLGGPGLTLAEAGQLVWAAQGENRPGKRTVPSAHSRYPLELYLVTAGSETLPAGIYHYQPAGHKLEKLAEGSPKATLGGMKSMQPWIAAAPAVFVIAGVPTRFDAQAKGTAVPFTYYEGGAAAQCLLLQAVALGLSGGTAGGLNMELLTQTLQLPANTQAMMVLPVGREQTPSS